MIKTLTAFTLTLALGAPAAMGQSSIEQLAPENTILLLGVDNVSRSIERFKRTPLHGLWNSPEMQELRRDVAREMEGEVKEFLRELGLEEGDAWFPTGGGGIALFAAIDAETGQVGPGLIGFADFGANADEMARVIEQFLQRREREGDIEYEEKEILGRTVYSVTVVDDEDDFDMDDFDFDFGPPGDLTDFMNSFHYVRNGSSLIVCSDLGALTESLDRLHNGNENPFAGRADYKAVMDGIGARDAHLVLLTRDLMQLVAGADPMGMAPMIAPVLKSVLGDIHGYGTSVELDGPKAMVEQHTMIYMPNGKAGLSKLIDAPAARESLPHYVGADAVGFSSFAFQFGRVAEVAREIVRQNPMLVMMMGDVEQFMAIVEGPVHDVLSTLGNRVHHVNTLTRPITLESVSQFFAIGVKQPQELENQIAMWAPQAGLEPRDFLGHRIYSAPGMMGMGMMNTAIGLGGGFVFIGEEEEVEQGLRGAADRDRPGALARERDYQRAVALLPAGSVVMWGYSDLVSSIEMMLSLGPMGMGGFGGDDWPFAKIDGELLRRHVGPMSWHMQSIDTGFIGHTYLLAAEEDDR